MNVEAKPHISGEGEAAVSKGKRILAQLVSPAIIYDEDATVTVSAEVLKQEILCYLESYTEENLNLREKGKECRLNKYLSYTTIGGFNVTWNRRKPTHTVFDKGTALVMEFEEDVSIPVSGYQAIGERTREGYGEIFFSVLDEEKHNKGTYIGDILKGNNISADEKRRSSLADASDPFIRKLCLSLFLSHVRNEALVASADEEWKPSDENKKLVTPTVSALLLMLEEGMDKLEQVREATEKRFKKRDEGKQAKLGKANMILEKAAMKGTELEKSFCESMKIEHFSYQTEGDPAVLFLREFLIQLKYRMRRGGSEA